MLNETELTILNSGQLSYGARLLYLTVLLPQAIRANTVMDFALAQLALSVCRVGPLGITVQEKNPSTQEIQTWLAELLQTELISVPLNETDNEARKDNQVTSIVLETTNSNRPDVITEIPDYIKHPCARGFESSFPQSSARLAPNTPTKTPWTKLAEQDEARAKESFSNQGFKTPNNLSYQTNHSTSSEDPAFIPDNSDPLAYMRRYARAYETTLHPFAKGHNFSQPSSTVLGPNSLNSGPNSQSSRDTPNFSATGSSSFGAPLKRPNADTAYALGSAPAYPNSNETTQIQASPFFKLALTINNGDPIILTSRVPFTKKSSQIFAMNREWTPDETLAELATFTGLKGIGYSREELNDFVTFWSLKDVAYDNTSWMLKFLRYLKIKRFQQSGRF